MTGFSHTEKSKDDNAWLTSRMHFLQISKQVNPQILIVRSMINLTIAVVIPNGSDQGIQFKLHSMPPEA